MGMRSLPVETTGGWLTEEILALLGRIEDPHVAKKRRTVLLLAHADATPEMKRAQVFDRGDCCNQRVWYQKWQYDPAISEAFEACYERALAWRDAETAMELARLRDQRLRLVGQASLTAIQGLEETAKVVRGAAGLTASEMILRLADDEMGRALSGETTPVVGAQGQDGGGYGRWQSDPAGFAREELGSVQTGKQIEIMESVRDNEVTVVMSANAVGKTHCAADVALWWVRCHESSEVYTAAAPPLENLERLLWGEINTRLMEREGLFVDATRRGHLRLELAPNWVMVGVSIPSSGSSAQREAKFSGKHSPHLLFIVDEADAVPDEVYAGIEACMSGGHARMLLLFNPREQTGPVTRLIESGARVIELDAFSHPNVLQGRDVIPGAVTRETVVRRIATWSRARVGNDAVKVDDSEWFQVPEFLDGARAPLKDGTLCEALVGGQWRRVTNPALSYMVLARFPGQADRQLISRAWVRAAQERWLARRELFGDVPPEGIRPVMGLDVAEFGVDRNVECLRYGGWVAEFESWGGVDVMSTGERAADDAVDVDARKVFVDATGVGSGTGPAAERRFADLGEDELGRVTLTQFGEYDCDVVSVKVGSSPVAAIEEGAFGLLRDELWWRCREWLRTDQDAMLPPGEGLANELCAPHYRIRRGKIKVDDKESLRDKLKRSPDEADALCLTFMPEEEFDFAFV